MKAGQNYLTRWFSITRFPKLQNMAKSSSTPPATLHPTNIRWSSRLQSTSSQPSTSLSKRKTTKKQNSLTPVMEQNSGGDTMKPASSPNVFYLPPLYPVVDPPGKSSVMSILTKVITMSSGLEVVSEGGNSMVSITTNLNTASDEEMGKDMGKDLDVNNKGGNDVLSTATAPKAVLETLTLIAKEKQPWANLDADSEGGNKELPTTTASDTDIGNNIVIDSEAETNFLPTTISANAALEAAMGKFFHNLDVDSEGGNKELPTTTAPDTDIGKDLVIDSEAENNFLPTAIADNTASEAAMGKFLHNLDIHSTIPTATAPTTPISTDLITGSIFQEGDIPKVHQTLASNYIPDALAKLKATSHKYFSEEGLYIHMSPWNDGNLDPIPYSYEKGYSKNRSTFVNTAPSDLKGSFTELKQFIDDSPNILTSSTQHLATAKREEGLLQLPTTATKWNGEENSSNFLVLGVPGEKNTIKGQNDSKRSMEDSRRILYNLKNSDTLDCGCLIETAIYELQWYHSWNVSGLVEGMIVTEDFSWKDIVTPWTQDMITQNISKETLLTANDYFTGDMEIMIDQDEERRHMMMVTCNITRLNELAARSNQKQQFVLMSIDVDSYDHMSVEERMGII
ncbi:hypothetical protein BDQ17DRAFT_1439865 [Cyathus striatus]|nr:hypothetical protein BDQ17DRAFT_1439865 [Cyathus striatus]